MQTLWLGHWETQQPANTAQQKKNERKNRVNSWWKLSGSISIEIRCSSRLYIERLLHSMPIFAQLLILSSFFLLLDHTKRQQGWKHFKKRARWNTFSAEHLQSHGRQRKIQPTATYIRESTKNLINIQLNGWCFGKWKRDFPLKMMIRQLCELPSTSLAMDFLMALKRWLVIFRRNANSRGDQPERWS